MNDSRDFNSLLDRSPEQMAKMQVAAAQAYASAPPKADSDRSVSDGFTVSEAAKDLHAALDNIGAALGDLRGAIAPVLMPEMNISGDNHQEVPQPVRAPVVDELIRAVDRLKSMYEGLHALRARVRV